MEKCQEKKNFAKGTVKRKENKMSREEKVLIMAKRLQRVKKRFMDLLIIGLMKTSSVLVQQNKDRRETTKVEE